jgi:hypothetical protein
VKAKIQNVTLSLPELLLRKFRVYAAERNQSMTALMTEAIRRMLDEQDSQEAAKRRLLERIHNAPNRGPGGTISWTRDEIYER